MADMEKGNRKLLLDSLRERRDLLDCGVELVRETKEIFDEFGKDAYATSYDNFAELEKSLNARELRIAVVGEYSRGKSSLLNAVLGVKWLPTAYQATTAINTFLYGLPDENEEPYMNIYLHDQAPLRRPLAELKRWSTELDKEHKEERKQVDFIEAHMSHPLLDLGLALIDTPGLESTEKHHEEITMRAIDSAHIAIWVQAANQLEGNNREWEFMKNILSRNFNRFLTVINWWDLVLDSENEEDRDLTPAMRAKKVFSAMRDNFRKYLPNMPEEKLGILTSEDNLLGVSAKWALSGNPDQEERSGVGKLCQRIHDICVGPEALEEITQKPMRSLRTLQEKLRGHLEKSVESLENTGLTHLIFLEPRGFSIFEAGKTRAILCAGSK